METPPLIVITGETASGKSALAMQLAHHLGAEIIAADSRTVYIGMDIGTAKPSVSDQKRITHHLLDVIKPDAAFSAAEFKQLALKVLADLNQRHKPAIMVGGTGLYLDAVLYDYTFGLPADPQERSRLNSMSVRELEAEVVRKQLPLPSNSVNPRHLIRVIETGGQLPQKSELRRNTLVLGLRVEREQLKAHIRQRVNEMFQRGLEKEVSQLSESYGWNVASMSAVGYKEFKPYFEGQLTLDEVREQIIKNTQMYAKRQRTWFRRNSDIHWVENYPQAREVVEQFLNNR